MKFKTIFQLFVSLLTFLIIQNPLLAQAEYSGVYQAGYMPFKADTSVKLVRQSDAYLIVPNSGDAWAMPLKGLRGAIAVPGGLWIYWFDSNDNTLNGYIKMSTASSAADDINAVVKSVNQLKGSTQADLDKNKQIFEDYKVKALSEAK
jgi:hypothetical protein